MKQGIYLTDFQAPEGSLVLTPLMSRKEASEMFYEWAKNTYGEYFWAYDCIPTWKSVGDEDISDLEDWKGIKFKYESDFQPLTKNINKI